MSASGALKRQGWTDEERKEIYDYGRAYPGLTWRGIERWGCTAGRQRGGAGEQSLLPSSLPPGVILVLLYLVLPLHHVNSLF